MTPLRRYQGSALLVSMVFVIIFSALAVGIAAIADANVQIASNQHKGNCAFNNAESGLHVQRYWLSRVMMLSSTPPSTYFDTIVASVQGDLQANNISNVSLSGSGSIPPVDLDAALGHSFEGRIYIDSGRPNVLEVYSTGGFAGMTRTIKVELDVRPYEHPIFDFGMATRGPVNFLGNPTFTGVTANWEADIYVESASSTTAVLVTGNTNFDGDVSIANSFANVDFQGDVLIAGDQGQTAIDNHVTIGVPPVAFPVPDTQHFLQYATGQIIDDTTDTSKGMTITNALIKAGTNPTFLGSVIIQGILYIQQPNQVTFDRNVSLQGIMVANGDVNNPGTNQILVNGNFATGPYPAGAEYDAIRHEVGSSILAPGFSAHFAGNYSTISGVMAVSGVHFEGNANALIQGTIINYSDTPAVVEGNATLNFDRVNSTKVPAGFDTHRVLYYNPSSYSMVF